MLQSTIVKDNINVDRIDTLEGTTHNVIAYQVNLEGNNTQFNIHGIMITPITESTDIIKDNNFNPTTGEVVVKTTVGPKYHSVSNIGKRKDTREELIHDTATSYSILDDTKDEDEYTEDVLIKTTAIYSEISEN